jgi:hypothetical protein
MSCQRFLKFHKSREIVPLVEEIYKQTSVPKDNPCNTVR